MLDRHLPVSHSDEVRRAMPTGGGETSVRMLTASAELTARVQALARCAPRALLGSLSASVSYWTC